MASTLTIGTLGTFVDRFHTEGWGQEGPVWLQALRLAAIERFGRTGLPTRRTPTWEHTETATLAKSFGAPSRTGQLDPAVLERAAFQDEAARLVFVDGFYRADLSRAPALPAGVIAAALSEDWEAARASLPAGVDDADALAALNLAFLTDGARIEVPEDVQVDHPIHIVHVHTRPGTATSTSHAIHVGRGAQCHVVESWVGSAPDTLTIHTTRMHLQEGARACHIKQQLEHDQAVHKSRIEVDVGRDAHASTFLWSDGGRWSRSGTTVRLLEPGAGCSTDGLWLGRDAQLHDCPTRIDHMAPHTTSQELYKGIMDGSSHGVFLGAVMVRPDAQKVDSQQTNRNLLLSDKARVDTTPQLEIHADDVKCAHGSTIGRLDPQALFFLRARGIDKQRAELLLTKAFAGEVLSRVGSWGIRTRLERRLENWFNRRGKA